MLHITLECRHNPNCIFSGQDILVDVLISNRTDKIIGYPLAFVQKRGPSITLIDGLTQEQRVLRINLAPYNLAKEFTYMKPGQSVTIEAIIPSSEIFAFKSECVDVIAKIAPAAKISVDGSSELVSFYDSSSLHIRCADSVRQSWRGN